MGLRRRRRRGSGKAASDDFLHETQYLVSSADGSSFFVQVEPEGMLYEFPPHERVLLVVRGRRSLQHMELTYLKDGLVIARPGDAEVWASLADGTSEQIGGFSDNPAPWIDTGHTATGKPPWDWPLRPAPETR